MPTGDMKGLEFKPPIGRRIKERREEEKRKKRGKRKEKEKKKGGLRGLWLKWQMKTAPQLRGRTKAQ